MFVEDIITDILKAEGWDKYTNDPDDRGGPTKWGITLKSYQEYQGHELSGEDEIKALTEEQAREFYEDKYIIGPKFHHLSEMLVPLVVDCAVNHGVSRAAKWVQGALGVGTDGVIGPKTIQASQEAPVLETYLKICSTRLRFYATIVANDPTQVKWLRGWVNRGTKWLDRLASQMK